MPKIIALCILLLICGGWAALADTTARQTGSCHPPKPGSPPEHALSERPKRTGLTSTGLDNTHLFLRMALAIGVVGGLGGLALYLSKREPASDQPAGSGDPHRNHLSGPRKALHLVGSGSPTVAPGQHRRHPQNAGLAGGAVA